MAAIKYLPLSRSAGGSSLVVSGRGVAGQSQGLPRGRP